MKDFLLCFVPLFVAVDAVGVLPMYLGLTEGLEASRVRRVLYQSVVTATAVALGFLVDAPLGRIDPTVAETKGSGTLSFRHADRREGGPSILSCANRQPAATTAISTKTSTPTKMTTPRKAVSSLGGGSLGSDQSGVAPHCGQCDHSRASTHRHRGQVGMT